MAAPGGGGRRRDASSSGKRLEEEVEQLISGLKLTEGELSGVRLGRRPKTELEVDEKLCLVGKLITKKNFNVDALVKTLTTVWRPRRGVDHKLLEGNLILFQFYASDDMSRVLRDGPWSFDGYALVLKEFEGDKRPTDIAFDRLAIWARIYNLPLNCMTKREGELLGATLGEVEEVEADKGGKAWGRFLRVRVKVHVEAPLPRGVMLYLGEEGGSGTWCRAAYEKLPNYCYHCGKLDHLDKDCPEPSIQGQKTQYGAWLRASPVRRKNWGGGNKEGTGTTPGRNDGARVMARCRLLDRLERADESEGRGEEASRGRQERGTEPQGEEGSASFAENLSSSKGEGAKGERPAGITREVTSGLGSKDVLSGDLQSRVLSPLPDGQITSSMEVNSPQKVAGKARRKTQTGMDSAKKVRKKYKAHPRGVRGLEGRLGKGDGQVQEEGTAEQGKRKLSEVLCDGSGSTEPPQKAGKAKRGKWFQGEVSANDEDMLLVDLVGADGQPHQEKCI